MTPLKDLTGKRFGRLVAVRFDTIKNGVTRWIFHCDCGTEKSIASNNVIIGTTQSCGCKRKDYFASMTNVKSTHGCCRNGSTIREYRIWNGLKQRCRNPKAREYKYYGAKGVKVCERWLSFENFISDMGICPDGLSIERINVNGDYEPSNCRWATPKEQANNRRNTPYLSLGDKTLPLMEWVAITGLTEDTIRQRKNKGWTDVAALTVARRITSRTRL